MKPLVIFLILIFSSVCVSLGVEKKELVDVLIGVRGGTPVYVLQGRPMPRDKLVDRIDRAAKFSPQGIVTLRAASQVPLKVVNDLVKDIKKSGYSVEVEKLMQREELQGEKEQKEAPRERTPLRRKPLTKEEKSFFSAVCSGDTTNVLESIKNGADVNMCHPVKEKMNMVMFAAMCKQTEVVKILLAHNADIEATDNQGLTVLMQAAKVGNADIVKLLTDKNAKLNVQDLRQRNTVLHIMARVVSLQSDNTKRIDVIKALLKSGADPNIRNESGWTPLAYAKVSKVIEVINALESAGGTLRLIDKDPSAETADLIQLELRTIGGAKEIHSMHSLAKSRSGDAVLVWNDIVPYIEPGSPLRQREGKDVLGNQYRLGSVNGLPSIDPLTAKRLKRFIEADEESLKLWHGFMPEVE